MAHRPSVAVRTENQVVVAEASTLDDARRIAAALNAVQGVPTAALEGGALDEARKLLVLELTPRQLELARLRDRQGKA